MGKHLKESKNLSRDIYSTDFVSVLFDSMSSTYGFVNYVSSFGFAERWRHQFIKQLPTQSEFKFGYDFMTGMGEVWASFDERFKSAKVIGVDISAMMLERAARKISKYDYSISLQQMDVLSNDIPDQSADFIVSSFGLKTFNEAQLGILADEVVRILKSGGVFSFVEISVPENMLRPLYMFYLKHVIPVIGKMFQGNPENYKMLGRYTTKFKNCRLFFEQLSERGLDVKYDSYFFGCATGVSGRKIQR